MCGIAGIVRFQEPANPGDVAAVLRMMDAQVHRGPDDWGLLLPEALARDAEARALLEPRGLDHVRTYAGTRSAPSAVLGSRRLSVIDLSQRGRMPMGTPDGRIWIAYNGEIYNARELRAELERRGYAFLSDTDTEAILHGYEEWGEEVVQRLRGMFAFAVLDASAGARLLLARDRVGIKPLYYHRDAAVLIFASEVRAVMRSGLVPNERSVPALVRFLQVGSVPQPLTTVEGVLSLPPAHHLSVDRCGARLARYWDLGEHLPESSHLSAEVDGHASGTRALLEESVKLHLASDVPLGIFLSGGIDSSALVTLASRLHDASVTTVSIVFEEPAYSEARYARLVAKQCRTRHHEVVLRSADLFEDLPRIFAAMDQPSVDGVNSYFVSKAARRAGLTVVLSGTGGDEVFLGYDHFRKASLLSRSRRLLGGLPVRVRRGLIRVAMQAGPLTGRGGLERLAYLDRPLDDDLYLLFRGLFAPRQIQDLLGMSERDLQGLNSACEALDSALTRSSPASLDRSLVDTFVLNEFAHYLNDQLLKDTDFMSMAHSIETRVPYLDHRLVERVAAVPVRLKLRNDVNKRLLVEAMGEDLPREVWDRPKMGFTFPFQEWLGERADELRAASRRHGLLDPQAADRVWREFREGRLHWSRAWALVVLDAFESNRTPDEHPRSAH